MKLTDKQKTLLLFAAYFSPALLLIFAGAMISWQQAAALLRAHGTPSWPGIKNLLLTFKFFVVIPALVLVASYVFCGRTRKWAVRGSIVYAAWLILGFLSSFLGAISCEGTSTAMVDGFVNVGKLFKELLSTTLYFLAWFHLFIIPWMFLFVFCLKRFPWLFAKQTKEPRILTSIPYDRPGITVMRPRRPDKKD